MSKIKIFISALSVLLAAALPAEVIMKLDFDKDFAGAGLGDGSFFQTEIAPLRRITPDVPVTANLMGTFTGLDYYALGRAMDISSWDNYPDWRGDERDLQTARISAS